MADEYDFAVDEYLGILELAYEVAQSIEGKVSADGRKPDSQHLALKLFAHATTAHMLYTGTKSPIPTSTGGSNFIDFSSVAVLARSALETYLTFFEVFRAPKNDDEFEFAYCLWHLSGYVVLEDLVPLDPQLRQEADAAQKEIEALRSRIKATAYFKTCGAPAQKQILRGKRQRDWLFVAKSAGFSYKFIRRIYAYYSGFVHADGLTAGQLMSAQTKKDQEFHAKIHLLTIMIVLSKFILDYGELFDEARAVFPKFKTTHERAVLWSALAANLG